MTGPEFDFAVRPQVLTAYAETLRVRGAELASAGEAVAAVRVERGWFGKLPQAGFLADRYAAHLQEVLAEVGELAAWSAAASAGLAECAGRYSAADRVVTGVAGAVEAALGVGIEIPGPPEIAAGGASDDEERGEEPGEARGEARG